jgi:hypothetical protein
MVVTGSVGYLTNPLVHHDYKGIERYIDRHNHYSSLEAVEAWRLLNRKVGSGGNAAVGDGGRRRRLKAWAYRWLPARAPFVFLYMYLARGGFLDGFVGLRYCLLRAIYEYQVDLNSES